GDKPSAKIEEVASGRFGVTAEYLSACEELEIKVGQGAKPGEGGQLMGVKVDEGIARARHARPGVDLISPPPLHDLYSIEDLKELIYELKQLHPRAAVCVKLVAGRNVGTVAVGVVKAGADIIQISGGDGGTGAAPISSMRHAGLPWELGLSEVHRRLSEHDLRARVRLRVDGGLSTAEDIVVATALGAEEYGFGKLLLVAQGCVMARVCEKNRCPTGIATHDPKFKAKYKGAPEHVVTLLRRLADDVRLQLAAVGARSLGELVGDTSRLELAPARRELVKQRRLQLAALLHARPLARAPAATTPASSGSRVIGGAASSKRTRPKQRSNSRPLGGSVFSRARRLAQRAASKRSWSIGGPQRSYSTARRSAARSGPASCSARRKISRPTSRASRSTPRMSASVRARSLCSPRSRCSDARYEGICGRTTAGRSHVAAE
ncbi:MAG: hypothetical protein KC468_35090, partial [Myxococcales bacterium]|nr:hypothetical protein [Myxococcales bacterium]